VSGAGLTLMGVRLYNPVTGLFTSLDPVEGGNANAHTYPADPINKFRHRRAA
jgi:RHS repeat-associated protein